MSRYRYNPLTGKLDLTGDLSAEDLATLNELDENYLDFDNITYFTNTDAVFIDYVDFPLTPSITVFVVDVFNNVNISYPITEYDLTNKSITISFNNIVETGFIILN